MKVRKSKNTGKVLMTVTLPKALDKKMEKYPTVNWHAVARTAFKEHLQKIEDEKGGLTVFKL